MDKSFYRKITILIGSLIIGLTSVTVVTFISRGENGPQTLAGNSVKGIEEQIQQTADIRNGTVTFIAVGDISFSRGVERVTKYRKDNNFPFHKTKDILSDADFTYGNLETPITPGEEIPDGSMVFRSNPGTENALKWAGFDIVNLANNHTYNYDEKGLLDTIKYLTEANINYVGAGKNEDEAYAPIFLEKNGVKLALLSYEAMDIVPAEYEATSIKPGISFMRINRMQEAVKRAKQLSDHIIVAMHAGEEYVPTGNDLQRQFAQAAIDAGAELVVGDHPHVIQNAEIYKGKIIFYNLGNFVMDQMWSDDTRRAVIFKGKFSKDKGLEEFNLTPVVIEHYSQPTPVEGTIADQIIKRLDIPTVKQYKVTYDQQNNNYEKTTEYTYKVNNTSKTNTSEISFKLENGLAKIFKKDELVWESPNDWYVSDLELANSINDGRNLINMSVWKPGNYGRGMPYWETENDMSVKNHLFVYELKDNKLNPVWQSSNLPAPNCLIDFYDADNDNNIELIAYEGQYTNTQPGNYSCNPTHLAVFRWKQWGFYNQWREVIN